MFSSGSDFTKSSRERRKRRKVSLFAVDFLMVTRDRQSYTTVTTSVHWSGNLVGPSFLLKIGPCLRNFYIRVDLFTVVWRPSAQSSPLDPGLFRIRSKSSFRFFRFIFIGFLKSQCPQDSYFPSFRLYFFQKIFYVIYRRCTHQSVWITTHFLWSVFLRVL